MYDSGILRCPGYAVPLRLAPMSGDRRTDRQTDGRRFVIPMVRREISEPPRRGRAAPRRVAVRYLAAAAAEPRGKA